MRVLYITTNFTALSSTFITREISDLRKLGLEVFLLATKPTKSKPATKPEADLSGCRFVYPAPFLPVIGGVLKVLFSSPKRFFDSLKLITTSTKDTFVQKLKLLYQLLVVCRHAEWIQQEGIDHIHAHFATTPTTFAMFLATLTGRTFSFTDHGSGLFHEQIGLVPKFRKAAGISAISEFNVGFYSDISASIPPVKIIRCGLDPDDFEYNPRKQAGDPLRILTVSRVVPKKGYTFLLDSLLELEKRGIAWEATLVGDGPILESLKTKSQTLGLKNLTFTGAMQQDQIRDLMKEADVLPLPCVVAPDGDMDGIPVTLMEAMACGCPVISTRLSGIPELVIDEKTGLLIEPEDVTALTEALVRIKDDPSLVAQISQGGRDWVSDEFNIHKSAKRQADFFRTISNQANND